jgi:hypothetical protein
MHVNSNGINWHGYYNENETDPTKKWETLYFEGCTIAIKNCEVKPHLKLIGGHVVATNVTCGGLQLSYCSAKLSQTTVDMIEGVSNSLAADNVGLYGMMSNIYCVDPITFIGNGIMDCVYQIQHCEMFMQADSISGLASVAKNFFVASTIYCTDAIKADLEALGPMKNTDCIWECEVGGIEVTGTAEVGQTVVVKAVDENGKPTEWMPGGKWEELYSVTLTEEVDSIHIGLPEPAKRIYIKADGAQTTSNTSEKAGALRVGRNAASYEAGISLPRMFRTDHVQGFDARFEANGFGIFGFAKVSSGGGYSFIGQKTSDINYIRIYGGIFGVGYKVTVYGEKEYRIGNG